MTNRLHNFISTLDKWGNFNLEIDDKKFNLIEENSFATLKSVNTI